jgi:hypothetical protein
MVKCVSLGWICVGLCVRVRVRVRVHVRVWKCVHENWEAIGTAHLEARLDGGSQLQCQSTGDWEHGQG